MFYFLYLNAKIGTFSTYPFGDALFMMEREPCAKLESNFNYVLFPTVCDDSPDFSKIKQVIKCDK